MEEREQAGSREVKRRSMGQERNYMEEEEDEEEGKE